MQIAVKLPTSVWISGLNPLLYCTTKKEDGQFALVSNCVTLISVDDRSNTYTSAGFHLDLTQNVH